MKNARHQQILELIGNEDIETQEELAERLKEKGFQVTQATVSRDIRQLELKKVAMTGGRSRYMVSPGGVTALSQRYSRVLRESYVSMDISMNIAVIRTVSGMAMAAAAALDSLDWPELLGCIAGDDTVMCVLREAKDADAFRQKLADSVKEE